MVTFSITIKTPGITGVLIIANFARACCCLNNLVERFDLNGKHCNWLRSSVFKIAFVIIN